MVNGLFYDCVDRYPASLRYDIENTHQELQVGALRDKSRGGGLINLNSYGLCKIKYYQTHMASVRQFRAIKADARQQGAIVSRKTDLLPYNSLKFDLQQHPKIDIIVNKLIDEYDGQKVIFCQDIFQFLRLKLCLRKLRKRLVALSENMYADEIGSAFARYKAGEAEYLLVSEGFLYQRMLIIKSGFLIMAGCSRYKCVFDWLVGHAEGRVVMLNSFEADSVRLGNCFRQSDVEEMRRCDVWVR